MREETIKFIDRIRNFKIIRDINETEYETMKRYHKSRINSCYAYLKFLTTNKNGTSKLKEDYNAVYKLSQECADAYLKWKETYEKNN